MEYVEAAVNAWALSRNGINRSEATEVIDRPGFPDAGNGGADTHRVLGVRENWGISAGLTGVGHWRSRSWDARFAGVYRAANRRKIEKGL